MKKYSPDTLRSLLAHDEDNITLADELQSAIAHTVGKYLGDKHLAVFALADDVLPVLVKKLEGLDLNDYITEEEGEEGEEEGEDDPTTTPQAELLNFRLDLMHESIIGIHGILQSFIGIKQILESIADSTLVTLDEKQVGFLQKVTEHRHIQDQVEGLIQSINPEGNQ